MGQVGAVDTLVVRLEVTTQLARHCLGCPTNPAGDLADTVPALT